MANLNVMAEHAEGARSRLCFIVRSFINTFLLPQLLSRLAHLDSYNRLDAVHEAFGVKLLSRKLQFLNARLYGAKFFDAH